MSNMTDLSPFFAANAMWAKNVTAAQPTFFTELAKAQAPSMIWIGCGDSRVPESVLLDQMPGKVFTHRNIANQYQAGDANAAAVVEYGVLHLNISNVVIVGHTGCGGANAAHAAYLAELASNQTVSTNGTESSHGQGANNSSATCSHTAANASALNTFLEPLIAIQREIGNGTVQDLILANVNRSVHNVANSPIFKEAWEKGLNVSVHGWLYNLSSGMLTDLNMSKHNFA